MISSLDKFDSVGVSNTNAIQDEIDYLRDTLEVLRATGDITNDAFLEAGAVHGGLSLILNLISQGISDDEANEQLQSLKQRAISLNNTHPDLDKMVESKR
ncbi:MAG: hypothetical protein CL606_02010 [Anaerolineaceae bacterium]|nr:hypothetical protein [Anaerolineaceae bacterium]